MLWTLPACALIDYGLQDPDSAVPTPVEVEEHFIQASMPGLDILFVVDGTGSMAEEQADFVGATQVFLDTLDEIGLAWQIGVTTTDPIDAGTLQSRPWIITPDAGAPAEALARALAVGTMHAPPSSGLDAAALALADADGKNRGFRRADAGLHVIFVSDGDDESGAVLGADPAAAFIALLADDAGRSGSVARASAVVGEAPDGCTGAHGSALAGLRYLAVADASGGAAVSICRASFADVAAVVRDLGVDWPADFPLQAGPAPGSVLVDVDGARTDEWALASDPPAVVFDAAPPPGAEIVVRYRIESAE